MGSSRVRPGVFWLGSRFPGVPVEGVDAPAGVFDGGEVAVGGAESEPSSGFAFVGGDWFDGPAALMVGDRGGIVGCLTVKEVVVEPAAQNEVAELGWSAVLPVGDVVGLEVAGGAAAGEAADTVVADLEGGSDLCWYDPGVAPD